MQPSERPTVEDLLDSGDLVAVAVEHEDRGKGEVVSVDLGAGICNVTVEHGRHTVTYDVDTVREAFEVDHEYYADLGPEMAGYDHAAERGLVDVTDAGGPADGAETLNGHPLVDLTAASEALDYLTDDYNDGDLTVAEGGRVLVVTTRTQSFQHFALFQRCEHVRISNVRAVDVGGDYDTDLRLKVELREVSE